VDEMRFDLVGELAHACTRRNLAAILYQGALAAFHFAGEGLHFHCMYDTLLGPAVRGPTR
jgi:hypothetical protein